MKIFDLSFFIKKRIYVIMSVACAVGIILIIISTLLIFNSKNNSEINSNILNLTSYYAEYEVTNISNKTENTYLVKEWYLKENEQEYFKFSYKDFMQNDFSIIVADNVTKIESSAQIGKHIIKSENISKQNLYSLITYIDMINKACFKTEVTKSEVTTTYTVYLNNVIDNEKSQEFKNIKDADKVEMYVIGNMLNNITVYKGEKEIIRIKYLEFKQDQPLNKELFEV